MIRLTAFVNPEELNSILRKELVKSYKTKQDYSKEKELKEDEKYSN